GYAVSSEPGSKQRHLEGSIATVISPQPFVLNVLAMMSAILGAVLKFTLDLQAKAAQANRDAQNASATMQDLVWPQLTSLFTLANVEALIAAMITALFFFNVYDSTELAVNSI